MNLQQIDLIITKLIRQSRSYEWVINEFSMIDELKDLNLDLRLLEFMGISFNLNKDNTLTLKSRTKNFKEEIFCIVDIESTGGIKNGNILEIGAVKIQNFKEIDHFCSLIKVEEIPDKITELTGINIDMVKNAPALDIVLKQFRTFLKDSIFVAHNVRFDYSFISKALNNCNLGILLNRRICTIEFAQCCIDSPRYKLETLKEVLGIQNIHHRALNDALAAAEIFKYCLSKLPYHIKTTEELISFIRTSRSKTNNKSLQNSPKTKENG
ncbi:3'-5' exonuclease [Campylobacter novaezeelandiae]|uniref:3'-5' exonuclease n=1 Tax=Campylobacter novaezeelandiae TaxID=2267891 RepID=A0A4Q9JWM4_9BACT|nr:3'-5' exonuclease [Campylobacter novaezeelandiae]TBR81471.1 3'-5' exonuclease [Campylobacter novaezeelandiae]